MSKAVSIKISLDVANWLFGQFAYFELPKKLSETKQYEDIQRSIVGEEVREAFKCFKAFSPYAQGVGLDQRLIFGHKEDWQESVDEKGNKGFVPKPESAGKLYEIPLTQDAVNGIVWLAFVLMFPSGEGRKSLSVGMSDLYLWPVIAQMKKTTALRSALGLTDSTKKFSWPDDRED